MPFLPGSLHLLLVYIPCEYHKEHDILGYTALLPLTPRKKNENRRMNNRQYSASV